MKSDVDAIDISSSRDIVLEALDVALKAWIVDKKHEDSSAVISVQKTHKLVTDYIKAMLGGDREHLPLVG